tara:strand:+ start:4063 stop:4248 length:186 start_codon:yes stop_codon:yes gene_type:complete
LRYPSSGFGAAIAQGDQRSKPERVPIQQAGGWRLAGHGAEIAGMDGIRGVITASIGPPQTP